MFGIIDGLPDGAVGVSASGTVSSDDYETALMPGKSKGFSLEDMADAKVWIAAAD